MKEKLEKRLRIHYAMILGVYWIVMAIFSVFVVPLLRQRGFDNNQIGILLAIRSFACIGIQPVVASFSDRYAKEIPLKYTISVIIGISLMATLVLSWHNFGFWGTAVIFGFLGATINALTPMYNSLAMQYLYAGIDLNFSVARGCGSVSWAFCCIFLGYMVDAFGVESNLILQAGVSVVSLLLILTFPKCELPVREQGKNAAVKVHSILEILKENRGFTLFLIASALLFVGNNMTTSFLVDVVEKLHGTNKDVGYAQFVLAAAEIPTAIFFVRMKKKIGTGNIMKICAWFIFIKTAAILLSPNIPVLIAVQAFQMLGGGLYWSGSVFYVNETISSEDRVKGQSLMTIASTGIGGGVGSVISGTIMNYYDINTLLMTGIVCAIIGVAVMTLAMKKSGESEKSMVCFNR